MIRRVVAWMILVLACVVVAKYGSQWRSPWAGISSPVLSRLPVASDGCGAACK